MKTLVILFAINLVVLAISGFSFFFTLFIGNSAKAKEDKTYAKIEKVNSVFMYISLICLIIEVVLYITMKKLI